MKQERVSTFYFKTHKGNAYLFDFNHGMFVNLPPFFENIEELNEIYGAYYCGDASVANKSISIYVNKNGYDHDEIIKTLEQIHFLKENGFFDKITINPMSICKLDRHQAQYNIRNIKHILFEVTEACNLQCYYCGYGNLYHQMPNRTISYMKTSMAIGVLEQLKPIWELDKRIKNKLTISFYGGEPLLNYKLIENVINYIEANGLIENVSFSITTNGVLLNKYIETLVKYDFKIDVSLDGDFQNNSYRITLAGKNPHSEILKTLHLLKKKHPNYFESKVQFQSVLSNINSVESIHNFFKKEFNKTPKILEVNTSNVKNKDEINRIFTPYLQSLSSIESLDIRNEIIEAHQNNSSMNNLALNFLKGVWHNYIRTHKDLFFSKSDKKLLITGTCTPFWKKMFITAKGDILPCERINYSYSIGKINKDGKLMIDSNEISEKYNSYYNNIKDQCEQCYASFFCMQCMFYIDNLENQPICEDFHTKKQFNDFLANTFSYIEEHPQLIHYLLDSTFYE